MLWKNSTDHDLSYCSPGEVEPLHLVSWVCNRRKVGRRLNIILYSIINVYSRGFIHLMSPHCWSLFMLIMSKRHPEDCTLLILSHPRSWFFFFCCWMGKGVEQLLFHSRGFIKILKVLFQKETSRYSSVSCSRITPQITAKLTKF